MAAEYRPWTRQGEAFRRAHHEAKKCYDLNQREYCDLHGSRVHGLPWRARVGRRLHHPNQKGDIPEETQDGRVGPGAAVQGSGSPGLTAIGSPENRARTEDAKARVHCRVGGRSVARCEPRTTEHAAHYRVSDAGATKGHCPRDRCLLGWPRGYGLCRRPKRRDRISLP
jgi:hypothetical protein